MIPTRAQMESFKFDPMSTAASDAGTFEGGVERDARTILNAITGLDWSGKAKFAASDRAIDESSDRKAVAKALGDIADATRSGQSALSGCQNESLSAAKGYEADGYNVAQDWTVTDGYNYGLADALAADDPAAQRRLAALKASRANTAKNATVKLKKLALDFHTADQACRSKLNGAVGALGSLAPVVAGLNPKAADGIVDALRSGKPLTAAQLQQLQAATNLTPEQLEALRTGHYVEIPQGQHSFMRTLLSGLDGMPVTDIRGLGAEGQQDQVQRALSNAMQLSSAPNVGTSAGDQGGMGLLPSNVRSLLTNDLVKSTSYNGDVKGRERNSVIVPRFRELMALSDVIGEGDPKYRMGTDMDRGMLKQVSEVVGHMNIGTNDDVISGDSDSGGREFKKSMSRALAAISVDTAATHDFITGENMNVTCDNGGKYNATSHINDLLDYHWGAERSGVDSIFERLKADGVSSNPHVAELARNAVDHLGHHLGSQDNLDENIDLGKRNPHLTRTLADLLSGYFGGFSGAPSGPTGVEGFDVRPMVRGELTNLFTIMDSDPEAARQFNKAANEWQHYMAQKSGANGDPTLGRAVALLSGAMEDGYDSQMKHQLGEQYRADRDGFEAKKALLTAGISHIPKVGPAISAALPADLMNELFGTPPASEEDATNPSIEALKKVKVHSMTDEETFQFGHFIGFAQEHPDIVKADRPDWFDDDGKIDWKAVTADNMNEWREYIYKNPQYFGAWNTAYDNGENAAQWPGARPDPSKPATPPK